MKGKVLIVVDVQNDFLKYVPEVFVSNIYKKIMEDEYDDVVFTRFVNSPNSFFVRRFNYSLCMPETEGIEIPEMLKPFLREDNVFDKETYSIFKSDKLLEYLNKNKVKDIDLCGLDLDACVLASAYEGIDLGYNIGVLTNLCETSAKNKKLFEYASQIISRNIRR